MSERDPYDGEPYYCGTCDAPVDGGMYASCDERPCELEARSVAQARKLRKRAITNIQVKGDEA